MNRFTAEATNLVQADTHRVLDVFVHTGGVATAARVGAQDPRRGAVEPTPETAVARRLGQGRRGGAPRPSKRSTLPGDPSRPAPPPVTRTPPMKIRWKLSSALAVFLATATLPPGISPAGATTPVTFPAAA